MRLASGVFKVTVTSGGSGYTSPPNVSIAGGGGTGASAVAQMAGTAVEAILVTNAGTGYTSTPVVVVSAGGGAGASGSASVLTYGSTNPICLFKGRGNDMYGVNGLGRGFRWDGDSPALEPLGISRPESAPVVTALSSGASNGAVRSVAIINGGAGYFAPPDVVFTGGGLTDGSTHHARARAKISGARVVGVTIDSRGGSYSSVPTLAFSGGVGSGATLGASVNGRLFSVAVQSGGTGYTSPPTVTFNDTNGLTGANVVVTVADGVVTSAVVAAAGTGMTTSGCNLSLSGGGGSGAQLTPNFVYTVSGVTIVSGGSNYVSPPAIGFRPTGGGADAIAAVAGGSISAATVLQGGAYPEPPSVVIEPVEAKAIVYTTQSAVGRYKCAIRYLDDTVVQRNGPIPSSISDFMTVEVEGQSNLLRWAWSNAGAESRVHKIELWRTTADQELVLYRVAILNKTDGVLPVTYDDTLSDNDLLDSSRADFGIMPVVMANGQINARRFEPPRITCSQACVFQDRAWYTCDTTGEKPNSIWHSEVDEPESAPELYEIVLQENHGDSDSIVGLLPFGAALLILQKRHLYKLQYVSQPLIDASVLLVAYRGAINARCCDVYDGVAFIADSHGLYAFDGNNQDTISVPVDNYWRDGIIDFTKSKYFHVRVNPAERVVRFYYCRSTDGDYPPRALCFCLSTKAWWEETYEAGRSAACPAILGGQVKILAAGEGGFYKQTVGGSDSTAIPYEFRTGPLPLDDGPSRSVTVLYDPCDNAANVRVHYNGLSSPRAFSVASDRGDGFTVAQGSTDAAFSMAATRSPLGQTNGLARLYMAGRGNDRSSGGDKHMAVALAGAKTGSDPVVFHAVTIDGVTA